MYSKYVKLLEERGLTTYRVSKDTGISSGTFSDWKNGRSIPKINKIKKLADYFNVKVDYFIS